VGPGVAVAGARAAAAVEESGNAVRRTAEAPCLCSHRPTLGHAGRTVLKAHTYKRHSRQRQCKYSSLGSYDSLEAQEKGQALAGCHRDRGKTRPGQCMREGNMHFRDRERPTDMHHTDILLSRGMGVPVRADMVRDMGQKQEQRVGVGQDGLSSASLQSCMTSAVTRILSPYEPVRRELQAPLDAAFFNLVLLVFGATLCASVLLVYPTKRLESRDVLLKVTNLPPSSLSLSTPCNAPPDEDGPGYLLVGS
jgi:hypothetical protein